MRREGAFFDQSSASWCRRFLSQREGIARRDLDEQAVEGAAPAAERGKVRRRILELRRAELVPRGEGEHLLHGARVEPAAVDEQLLELRRAGTVSAPLGRDLAGDGALREAVVVVAEFAGHVVLLEPEAD